MLKKYINLICILVVLSLLASFYWLRYHRSHVPKPGYLLENQESNFQNTNPEIIQLIQSINDRNSRIQTFACNDIRIKLQNRLFVWVSGDLYYEKQMKLRMNVKSIFGKELDIGSNDDYFWFWSKRLNPPALYYATHENLHKTMLKTPFHPFWMKGCLGFDHIPNNIELIRKQGKNWELIQRYSNPQGLPILRSIVIDPRKLSIIGHYLYENDQLVISAEVYEHQWLDGHYVPSKIMIKWYEEGIVMTWDLHNPRINDSVSQKFWVMPTHSIEIDMGQ